MVAVPGRGRGDVARRALVVGLADLYTVSGDAGLGALAAAAHLRAGLLRSLVRRAEAVAAYEVAVALEPPRRNAPTWPAGCATGDRRSGRNPLAPVGRAWQGGPVTKL